MKTQDLHTFKELAKAEKYFEGTKYQNQVAIASKLCIGKDFDGARVILQTLPTENQLLERLVNGLKGKSVYRTLKAIESGKVTKGPAFLKGLFSLGTHTAIEVERGNKEYRLLYPVIYERLGEILFNE